MKTLPIIWQRLVSAGGKTCDRCQSTHQEIVRAVGRLTLALRPLGIEPVLETRTLNEESFRADPSESNRLWIGGKPMEDWIGARVGSSRCCSVCGDLECRTVESGGRTFEAIPETLVLKAGLIAAAQLLDSEPETSSRHAARRCCET